MRKRRRTKKRNPKRYRYRHIGKRKARLYDKRSIRTIRIGRHGRLMRVGCPKGYWRPRLRRKGKKGRCDRGMQGFEILTPKRRSVRRLYRRRSVRVAANPDETVNFDANALRRLKMAYRVAVRNGKTQFTFQGHELLTSYAKYLIEYLETQLPKQGRNPGLVPQRLNRTTIYRTRDGKYAGTVRDESDRRGKSFAVATASGRYGYAGSRWDAINIIEDEFRRG